MSNRCPCIECICVAICNGKTFSNLMSECRLVADYYYLARSECFRSRLETIINVIHPSWEKSVTLKYGI
jgi:hypothetical protein